MTADIPEWAMEKAQSTIEAYIDAAMPSIKQSAGWRDQDLYRAVAAALASVAKAERERAHNMHRRAQIAEGKLERGATKAREQIDCLTNVAKRLGRWPVGTSDATRAMEQWLAAILSDGGRDG